MRKKIGFIGVGNMGSRMADRLIAAGHEVIVCDAFEKSLERYAAQGIVTTIKPKETANADIVILMVADDQQLISVIAGDDGVISGLDWQANLTLLIMSTGLPKTMLQVQELCRPFKNVKILEAPVSGGVGGAERGTLSIMMGGDPIDIDEVMPIVQCMGKSVFRCGPYGTAQTVKLINNMIGLTNLYMTAEGFDIAVKSGVDLDQLGPILEASTGRSFISQDIETARFQYANWARDPEAFAALSRIVRKDMQLAVELAKDVGIDAGVLNTVAGALGDASGTVFERWHNLGQPK
jgi:3-hydroxyisobutyrate dehydrogenase